MNIFEKVKADERIVEVRKSIDSGESCARPAAKIASGVAKKVPVEPGS
jgi:hypothetical protein